MFHNKLVGFDNKNKLTCVNLKQETLTVHGYRKIIWLIIRQITGFVICFWRGIERDAIHLESGGLCSRDFCGSFFILLSQVRFCSLVSAITRTFSFWYYSK